MRYRRALPLGGTYFFTVNLLDRKADTLVRHIDEFRAVLHKVKEAHPFSLVAMAVMPDHLHTIWRLPEGDADYPMRWSLVKAGFSRRLSADDSIRPSRKVKRERGIWQRRYWEHHIRDHADLARHVDYIHYNPVKHGLVNRPVDWPYSTLQAYIERGISDPNWAAAMDDPEFSFGGKKNGDATHLVQGSLRAQPQSPSRSRRATAASYTAGSTSSF